MRPQLNLVITLAIVLAASANGAENTPTNALRLETAQGGRVRIQGTMDHMEWQAEDRELSGFVELGPGFPLRAMQQAKPGKVQARLQLAISVMGLKTVTEDGRPQSDSLDKVMHEKLRAEQAPEILFYSHELTLREPAKDEKSPAVFDAKGHLVVACVTNTVSLPVTVTPLKDGQWRLSAQSSLKMTAFGIEPPVTLVLRRTQWADQVHVTCDWIVAALR